MSPIALVACLALLGAVVPATAGLNVKMATCNATLMPSVPDLDLDQFEGRWFVSHVSTSNPAAGLPKNMTGYGFELRKTIPPVTDNKGDANRNFMIFAPISTYSTSASCSRNFWLCEQTGGSQFSSAYFAKYFGPVFVRTPGYYVGWSNYQVLATDYNTTAVMLMEAVTDGYSDLIFSELQIFVRDPTATASASVLQEAFGQFCAGTSFGDPSSDLYVALPNDSQLDCFNPNAQA